MRVVETAFLENKKSNKTFFDKLEMQSKIGPSFWKTAPLRSRVASTASTNTNKKNDTKIVKERGKKKKLMLDFTQAPLSSTYFAPPPKSKMSTIKLTEKALYGDEKVIKVTLSNSAVIFPSY